jgi:acetolactate synthase-1/2/3 large subunit
LKKLIKVSDYIADFFPDKGVNKCFVVTGGGAMHLNDSIGHHPRIECIYNHHEQACSMAAEGYTRITGIPALVCVTSGPGSTNTVTGVLGAWLDSVPMVVLSGQMKFETTLSSTILPLRQLGFQEFNIIDSVEAMTKYAEMIVDPNYIAYHLEKALHLSTSGRKGPVWLDIPLDIQAAMVDPDDLIHYDFGNGEKSLISSNHLDNRIIETVIEKINSSEKPVILVGYGIRMSNCYESFIEMVSKLKVPVLTEWNCADLIWNDFEFYAGRPGTIGDRGGNFVLQNADLIFFIGCQLSIRQISYAWENFAKKAFKIGLNIDKYELLKPTIKINLPIQAEIQDFIKSINISQTISNHRTNSEWFKWCIEINKKYPVVTNKNFEIESPISVYAFMKTLSKYLKTNDVVVLANGAACVCGLQAIEIKKGLRVFTNAGASSMGYGIAASIGVAYAQKKGEQVICIEGDGSIQMNLQELQTIVHNNLNIKIFWINNGGYHSIKQTQNSMFNAKERGLCGADNTSGLSFPSAEKIAFAYGIKFEKISGTSALDDIISKVLDHSGPVICEIISNPDEDFQPKLQSKLLNDGKFYTPSLEDMYPFLSKEEMNNNIFKGKK